MNLMDTGEFNGRMLYTGLTLDYRLRLWVPASASRYLCGSWAYCLVCKYIFRTPRSRSNIKVTGSMSRTYERSTFAGGLPSTERQSCYKDVYTGWLKIKYPTG